jgi:hypothetical protein
VEGILMKRLLLCVVLACVSAPLFAAPVQKGLYEVTGGVSWDVSYDGNDKLIPVYAGLGYYSSDRVQAGGLISFTKKSEDSFWGVSDVWGLGAFCEYNFTGNSASVPYAGISARLLDGGGDVVVVGDLFAGIKVFVVPTVALFGQVNFSIASDEIYDFDRDWLVPDRIEGQGEPTDVGISAGVRVVLW